MPRNLLERSVLAQRALAALRAKATPTTALTSHMTENVYAPAPDANAPGPPDKQLAEILLGSEDGSVGPTGFTPQEASGYAMPGTRRAYRELAEVAPFVAKRKAGLVMNVLPGARQPATTGGYSPELNATFFAGAPTTGVAGHENIHRMQRGNFPALEGWQTPGGERDRTQAEEALRRPAPGRIVGLSQQDSDYMSSPSEWQGWKAQDLIEKRLAARAVASLAASRQASRK